MSYYNNYDEFLKYIDKNELNKLPTFKDCVFNENNDCLILNLPIKKHKTWLTKFEIELNEKINKLKLKYYEKIKTK